MVEAQEKGLICIEQGEGERKQGISKEIVKERGDNVSVKKNITLDGAAMILMSLGINAIRSGEYVFGFGSVILGIILIELKYQAREYL